MIRRKQQSLVRWKEVADGTQVSVSHKVGMMTHTLGQAEVRDGRFELSFLWRNPNL